MCYVLVSNTLIIEYLVSHKKWSSNLRLLHSQVSNELSRWCQVQEQSYKIWVHAYMADIIHIEISQPGGLK